VKNEPWSGVFPILVTPFDRQERVDEESLRRLVDYNIDAGVHGFGIAFATEIPKLLEEERLRVATVVVDQCRGRVPVVVNSGYPSTYATVACSEQAQDLGADAVMCVPPEASAEETRAYFKAVADAVEVPIFVQEAAPAIGAALMRQIADETGGKLRYAKVENAPQPKMIEAAVKAAEGKITVFGGASGSCLIEELRRGSRGTMPWPSRPRSFARVWEHWEAGEEAAAEEVWAQEIHPVLRIQGLVHKQILYREGVIATPLFRSPQPPPLDATTQREFDALCERLDIGQRK
jgi:dihydrodipicolinate synthase/N-acetylneuraminate lyase